jgi:hypothetical protein
MILVSAEYSVSSQQIRASETVGYAIVASAAIGNDEISFPVEGTSTVDGSQDYSVPVKSSGNQSEVSEAEVLEWTPKLESKFTRLAQSKALKQLSLAGQIEFERLSSYRRQLKNPRTGEEVIAEYEQRALTEKLVQVLGQYVEWHKQYSSNSSR